MNIKTPAVLFALFGLLPVALVFWYEFRHTSSALRLLGRNWSDEAVRRLIFGKWLFSLICFAGFYVSCVLALAGWEWGEQAVQRDRSSLELAVVMDCSRSMQANDLGESRRERGLGLVREVLDALPASRVALVGFDSRVLKLVPLTEDRLAIANGLDRLADGQALGGQERGSAGQGSNLSQALDIALNGFRAASPRNQAILLVSDGETNGAPLAEVLNQARLRSVPVAVVGTGTVLGGRIPLPEGGWYTDGSGREVYTRLDRGLLTGIAETTQGWFVMADQDQAAQAIIKGLRDYVERSEREGFILAPVDRDNVFVFAALVFLCAFLAVRAIRWRSIW